MDTKRKQNQIATYLQNKNMQGIRFDKQTEVYVLISMDHLYELPKNQLKENLSNAQFLLQSSLRRMFSRPEFRRSF
ncbi:hypothetical protein T11_5820 [Trichinella zimbabwensis]|uniref:Uncharacterized protein n=1 Tax=Trichinella zimbabwensis TaxID=268475 RepID=A0A0V1HFB2_9BILA|nr:hypothetical protein T11_5820 [Trichinella zimbabwensis]